VQGPLQSVSFCFLKHGVWGLQRFDKHEFVSERAVHDVTYTMVHAQCLLCDTVHIAQLGISLARSSPFEFFNEFGPDLVSGPNPQRCLTVPFVVMQARHFSFWRVSAIVAC
jgi:hypothetical protein